MAHLQYCCRAAPSTLPTECIVAILTASNGGVCGKRRACASCARKSSCATRQKPPEESGMHRKIGLASSLFRPWRIIMKRTILLRYSAALFSFAILGTPAAAELTGLPNSLSGRWTAPNGSASQSVSLSIESASGTGKLTVWSNNSSCTISGAPATITKDGNKIVVIVSKEYSNPCRDNISMVLTKKDGAEEYEGEIHQNVPGYSVLKVKLNP